MSIKNLVTTSTSILALCISKSHHCKIIWHNVRPCHVFLFAVTMRSRPVWGESVRRLLAPGSSHQAMVTRSWPGGARHFTVTGHPHWPAHMVCSRHRARLLLVKISRLAPALRWWWDDDMILIMWAQDSWHKMHLWAPSGHFGLCTEYSASSSHLTIYSDNLLI